ncbi:hypothetical protein ACFP63_06415 [Oerskovia jenensis]|uniref:Uncharacterized protein n=1 Tax=Oerskovia jenensis TaxID=162169 RepID=A0ABS2LGX5_9CELL|nr:hypothetical protein [Oerskovia jenensis]MBM7479680.1 hypothetical protein [Oerskovia jenensis]
MDRPDAVSPSTVGTARPGFGPGDDVVLSTETDDAQALAALESLVAYLEQDSA